MADLTLNINGNDNGASAVLTSVAGSVTAAGAAFAAFTASSIRAAEEGAKADRILERASGDLAEAFKEQASAMQASLGVSDDLVKQMQSVLLTFGQAPADVEKTTRAILDYAAFTGEDALSATKKLTSSIESGKQAFKDYGVQYETTGVKSKDLVAAVDALQKKFGGSAEADANSLTGTISKSKEAFGDLEKTWGGLVASFVVKTEAVDNLTFALGLLTKAIRGPDEKEQLDELSEKIRLANEWLKVNKAFETSADAAQRKEYETRKRDLEDLWDLTDLLESRVAKANAKLPSSPLTPGDGLTNKAREDRKKAAAELEKENAEALKKQEERAKQMFRDGREQDAAEEEAERKSWEDTLRGDQEFLKAKEKLDQDAAAREIKHAADNWNAQRQEYDKFQKEQEAAFAKQEKQWADAGAAIGGALVNQVSGALETLMSGGEVDAGEMIGDVIASILGVAGARLGSVLLPGAGTAIGGAVGGLAGQLVRAGTRRRRHDGGWIDAPRYHGGAWVGSDEQPFIGQSGERVLSRPEVAAMGGRDGVEAAVRGRGGTMVINVNTFDGATAREYFERAGGRALRDTVRTGRGVTAQLLGGL